MASTGQTISDDKGQRVLHNGSSPERDICPEAVGDELLPSTPPQENGREGMFYTEMQMFVSYLSVSCDSDRLLAQRNAHALKYYFGAQNSV